MRVYKYWAEPATPEDSRMLMQQLSRAAEYRRDLVAIENRARALQRSILSLPKEQRAPLRERVVAAQRAESKRARERARLDDPIRGMGCAWGTCGQVDDSFDLSQRTTKIWDDVSRRAARDEGVLGIQFMQHASDPKWRPTLASSLVGGDDTFVQIGSELIGKPTRRAANILDRDVASRLREAQAPPDQSWGDAKGMADLTPGEIDELRMRRSATPMPTGAKRLRALRFRVGSSGRAPIWANLYVLMHRPLPAARVTWVKLSCRRTGLRHRWFLLVVVDEECRGTPDPHRAASVGVDIGWRMRDDGSIRIAYWVGSDGREGELAIPRDIHRRKGKSDSLRSIMDRERDEVAGLWRAWIFGTPSPTPETDADRGAPGERDGGIPSDHPVRVAAQTMHAWRRTGRFVILARLWDANRIPGDEEIHARVQAWLRHNRHLLAWESNNRRRMALKISGRVDSLAVQLARQYQMVAVESRGMVPELVRKDGDEDDKLRALNASRVGIVAPAQTRMALERFAKKYGAIYREVNPAYTTQRCAKCGAERDPGDARDLALTCGSCGFREDQDRTAAENIRRAASAQVEAERADALAPASTGSGTRKLGVRRNRRKAVAGPLENTSSTRPSDS